MGLLTVVADVVGKWNVVSGENNSLLFLIIIVAF